MGNSNNYPQPNPKIDYLETYTQGNAVEDRQACLVGTIDAAVKWVRHYKRYLNMTWQDDSFGQFNVAAVTDSNHPWNQ